MEEVSNTSEVQETVQMESAAPQAESGQETTQQSIPSQEQVQSDPQDKSWVKKVRRDRDEAIRRAQEAERKNQVQEELLRQIIAQQSGAATAKEDVIQKLQSQEYVAGEEVARALKQQQEEFRKEIEELKKQQQTQQQASHIHNLKREFSDFEDVVNPETLELLKDNDPETYESIDSIKDPAKAMRLAYKTIKLSGLVEKLPENRHSKEVEKRLEKNKQTIQSPVSLSTRPMAQAFKLPETKKEKEALWAETLKYASMSGGGY